MRKSADAFRTISEVAEELRVPKHVLRFWEGKFPQIRPMKRGGGRRYYRPEDLLLLRGIQHLLHDDGYTIKGVQKILREQGIDAAKEIGQSAAGGEQPDESNGADPASANAKTRKADGTTPSATGAAARPSGKPRRSNSSRPTARAQPAPGKTRSDNLPKKGTGARVQSPAALAPAVSSSRTIGAVIEELEQCRGLLTGEEKPSGSARPQLRTAKGRLRHTPKKQA